MEGTLNVTPEVLIQAANEFQTQGTTISNLTSQMTTLATGLSSCWEGEAATAYVNKFKELDDDIQKMIRMVNEHVTDLTDMAKIYQDAEKQNTDIIANLSGDVII